MDNKPTWHAHIPIGSVVLNVSVVLSMALIVWNASSAMSEIQSNLVALSQRVEKIEGSEMTPTADRRISVLEASSEARLVLIGQMRVDLANRLDRIERKLDALN